MTIKLVLFDADGTLWEFTRNEERIRKINEAYVNKEALQLLKILKRKNISCKILTYQQYKNKNYSKRKIKNWLYHFNILKYFNGIFIAAKNMRIKKFFLNKLENKIYKVKKYTFKEIIRMLG